MVVAATWSAWLRMATADCCCSCRLLLQLSLEAAAPTRVGQLSQLLHWRWREPVPRPGQDQLRSQLPPQAAAATTHVHICIVLWRKKQCNIFAKTGAGIPAPQQFQRTPNIFFFKEIFFNFLRPWPFMNC